MLISREKLSQAQEVLQSNPAILAAYLHGSQATHSARMDSDVDIAILPKMNSSISLKSRLELAGELESIFGRTVDLGKLTTHNLIYAKEVALHGKELFSKNRFKSDRFMATCLSMYAELQQQRKKVLNAYAV